MQIKAADSRHPDIVALERLLERQDVPAATRKRIEDEIRNIRAGEKGEHDAAYEIELWFGRSPHWASIHDLRIEVDGLAAQIDHVLINRFAEMWLLESKSFAEGVSVNEHGEWTRWWHRSPTGMSSPIEQNRRHIELVRRVFNDGLLRPPRRLGLVPMKPAIRSLVLVSNSARIGRPKRKIDGLDQVIKAEQLKTRLFDEFDHVPDWKMVGIIGKEGLDAFARSVAALHRPASVDWASRFGLSAAASQESAAQAVQTAPAAPRRQTGNDATRGECARCRRGVSDAVVRYCEEHVDEFGAALYCMRCQPIVRARAERPVIAPTWPTILARYRAPTRLRTVARQAPFIVVASGDDLRISPESSERYRTLTRADFERSAPLLGRSGRAEVNEASRNSSYVEAILADFERQRDPS